MEIKFIKDNGTSSSIVNLQIDTYLKVASNLGLEEIRIALRSKDVSPSEIKRRATSAAVNYCLINIIMEYDLGDANGSVEKNRIAVNKALWDYFDRLFSYMEI